MKARLSKDQISRLVAEIEEVARCARISDPDTKGRVCYPYMSGGLGAILKNLVGDLAGEEARSQIETTLEAAYARQAVAA